MPSIFWKYVSGEPIVWEDIQTVNLNQYVCLEKISKMTASDLEYLDEKFTTFLGDGQEYELEYGGRMKTLTFDNRAEYVEKSKVVHMSSLMKAFEMIKRGLEETIFPYYYSWFKAPDLEKKMMGMNYVIYHNFRLTSMCSEPSRSTRNSAGRRRAIPRWCTSGTFCRASRRSSWRRTCGTCGAVRG
jgi:hypothetical protein